jgi:EPS-associated MarR family transcriptional regulator
MARAPKKIHPDVHYRALNLLEEEPNLTQRELAEKLGISLGSVNYCLNALIDIGHIKAGNFKQNPDKSIYLYLLTPKGIAEKSSLAVGFLKRKMAEYHALKKEIEAARSKVKKNRNEVGRNLEHMIEDNNHAKN